MMSSRTIARRSSSVSPGRRGRASTNIGTMTSGQPWRISERVPSKSNRTWPIPGRGASGAGSSTLAQRERPGGDSVVGFMGGVPPREGRLDGAYGAFLSSARRIWKDRNSRESQVGERRERPPGGPGERLRSPDSVIRNRRPDSVSNQLGDQLAL